MLAIIPARGGSKGLPGKNVLPLGGKPLIAHTILAAKDAKGITRVVVSTDDATIAETASAFGAEVPFLRPAHLATDTARAIDAYLYTVERLEREEGISIESFCVLLPTSPLRTSKDIDAAVELFRAKEADSVVAVSAMHPPPEWAKRINADGTLETYPGIEESNANRQESSPAYAPNGAIYVFRTALLRDQGVYYSPGKSFPYVMPRERSVDIDDKVDFRLASLMLGESHV